MVVDSCEMVGSIETKSKSRCIVTDTAMRVSVSHSFITLFWIGNVQLVLF